jgi:sugar (pentulose or hexulose) kinase
VGAGNGLRENRLLAQIVAAAFREPMRLPVHREEAAYGAALMAAVGTGVFPSLKEAGRLIHYETVQEY